MSSTTNDNYRNQGHRLDGFPALASLRLTAPDLAELARQGFVCAERRGARTYYKLRFRSGGKQVVRYIGHVDRAALVKAELAEFQADSKAQRELNVRVKVARQMLRDAKRALEPVLNDHGFVFHGLAIRRPRKAAHSDLNSESELVIN